MTHTKTKQQPKLSVIRKGHWRNRAWIKPELVDFMRESGVEFEPDGNGEWIGRRRWVSQEMADQAGQVIVQRLRELSGDGDEWFRYLGSQFFPEEGEQ